MSDSPHDDRVNMPENGDLIWHPAHSSDPPSDSDAEILKSAILAEAKAILDAGMVLKLEDLTKLVLQKHSVTDETFRHAMLSLLERDYFVRSRDVIETLAQELVDAHIISDKSKLSRFNLLDNENRRRIYQYIKEHPGTTYSELEVLDKSPETIYYHLEKLLEFNFIRFRLFGRTKAYYPLTFPPNLDARRYFSRKETTGEIIRLLETRGPLRLTEVSNALQKHHSTIQYHLKQLLKHDIVAATRVSRRKRYRLEK